MQIGELSRQETSHRISQGGARALPELPSGTLRLGFTLSPLLEDPPTRCGSENGAQRFVRGVDRFTRRVLAAPCEKDARAASRVWRGSVAPEGTLPGPGCLGPPLAGCEGAPGVHGRCQRLRGEPRDRSN